MIVKYTFNDNDFTQIIEKFLEEFGPYYGFNYPTFLGKEEFINLSYKYDNLVSDLIPEDEEDAEEENAEILEELKEVTQKLNTLLKISFTQYISNIAPNSNWKTEGFDAKSLQKDKEYILNNIKIEIIKEFPDKWDNGESVYLFTKECRIYGDIKEWHIDYKVR